MIYRFKSIIVYLLLKSKKLNPQARNNSKQTIENSQLIEVQDDSKK